MRKLKRIVKSGYYNETYIDRVSGSVIVNMGGTGPDKWHVYYPNKSYIAPDFRGDFMSCKFHLYSKFPD